MSKFFRNADGQVYNSYDRAPYSATDIPVSQKDGKAAIQEQAKEYLRSILKPGALIHTILRHASASGMSRRISLIIANEKAEVINLDYWVARAKGEHIDGNHSGLKVRGCGMDMGFDLVYNLGAMLWPDGTETPHGTRNGVPDSSGGYALNQVWL